MRSNPFEVDDARLSDLGIPGMFGLALAVGAVVLAVEQGLKGNVTAGIVLGGFLGLIGAGIAHDDATPECDATCAACGERVRSHASRDGVDEFVEVHSSGSPRRISLGPLSVVKEEQTLETVYCSGACAAADDRVLLERDGERLEPVQTNEGDRREEVV
ncbi:hypothetical protein [Halosimplex pelagicum]|uniref:Uncharacterized protein n=1 Tax=Halosimplex pelagicum TaxID=869886 RepID=A0A7D5PFF7_9EURY|nr:hypothetical protein [Halosimplex pelagicum]QLH83220.1 hypothetical protein HZS54_16985 [Halosimplex pelagicum]